LYLYTPTFTDPDTGAVSPGKTEDGAVILAVADVGPNCRSLTHDDTVPRFVLSVADGTAMQAGWATKTADEVNADYPGLI
jgi:hypothetical protein